MSRISDSTAYVFHARGIQNKITGLDDINANHNDHLDMSVAAKEAETTDHNKCVMIALGCSILFNQVLHSHSETFFLYCIRQRLRAPKE